MEVTINRCSQIATQKPSIWTIYFLLAIALLCCCTTIESAADCPRLCECKWKSGKESVLCLNANLTAIPTKLDAGTQILDLTRNDIQIIVNDEFSRANLLNLQKLFLTKCHLKTIERFAFRKLINLVELDLSDNLLSMVPSHALESIPELRELKLIGNPIRHIFNDAFEKVPQLIRLELSNCNITTIDVRAFSNLETSLEWLNLDNNKLLNIQVEALLLLQNLHGLELAGNPWNCSCNLRPLREWMLRENIPFHIPPMCKYPKRLAEQTWDKIDLDEYACKPNIFSHNNRFHTIGGRNVTMSCAVDGIPVPNIRWMIRNRVIFNLTGNTSGANVTSYKYQQNASNLTILRADSQDAGVYICAAENKAGKVEVSVTLAVSKEPSEIVLNAKVILASIIAFVFFVIATVLVVIAACTLKRRKKLVRWNTQGRTNTYEGIELNNKPNYNASKSPRGDRSTFTKSYAENGGISVVGLVRRNIEYRNVPSDDDGTDYFEDNNAESNNKTISNIRVDDVFGKWNAATSISKSAKRDVITNQMDSVSRKPLQLTNSDLHIPRLIEFSDSATPDSSIDLYDSNVSKRGKTNTAWSNQIANREHITSNTSFIETNYGRDKVYRSSDGGGGNERRVSESDCDIDKMYPDLCRTAMQTSVSTSSKAQLYIQQQQQQMNRTTTSTSNNNKSALTARNNPFCTFPRKKHASNRRRTDSQSPLLNDSTSQNGSSTLTDIDLFDQRLSSESFNNYPLSICTRYHQSSSSTNSNSNGQRSNSFLSLTTQTNSISGVKSQNSSYSKSKRNPSLPTSPTKGGSAPKLIGAGETPLLDFSSFAMHKQQMIIKPSLSTSRDVAAVADSGSSVSVGVNSGGRSASANAYDYHAAQLERFLEEYHNLQEQLCKMKETCESIRKKEAPLRTTAGNSEFVQVADPIMFTALNNPNVNSPLPFDAPSNPKGILKTKILLPNQPPDPPPYWLHRNAMLKRLQDPNPNFSHS